jgi:DNA repair protein RadC
MLIPEIKIKVTYDKIVKKTDLFKITNSNDAFLVFSEQKLFDVDTFDWIEEMLLLCLNRANRVIGYYKMSKGGFSGTVADPKVIFTTALNCGASSVIVAHNHPSGNLQPSEADIKFTKNVLAAGKFLEINLMDSLILSDNNYKSLADDGYL